MTYFSLWLVFTVGRITNGNVDCWHYELFLCVDINECEQRDMCQHECVNTPGSHKCLCPNGYRLMTNGKTCQGKNKKALKLEKLKLKYYNRVFFNATVVYRLLCDISRYRRVLGAKCSVWSKQNVLQHERQLPVHRHALSTKLSARPWVWVRPVIPLHKHYRFNAMF